MDETGVLSPASKQRFFALGLLKIIDTSDFYQSLVVLKSRIESKLPSLKPFEFKFSTITKTSYNHYKILIDLYFNYLHVKFCCLLIDKQNPQVDISKYFNNIWDAYLTYSSILINNNIKTDESVCIIADYFGKPGASRKFFEREMNKIPKVYNAVMIESHASLFVQVVDVLIGCISYDYKINRGDLTRPDMYKKNVCDHLKSKIGKTTLIGNFTINSPSYFSVWEFKPRP